MSLLGDIQAKFARDEFEFSRHAVDQTIRRGIAVREIRETVAAGTVIEDYPNDKYGPSCLIFGRTLGGRPLQGLTPNLGIYAARFCQKASH